MIDKLIDLGAEFDWITPLATFVQDWRNRPSTGYNISVDSGWSAYAVRGLLQARGVKMWGLTIVGSVIVFRVRKAQAAYAQYLMRQAGIPFVGGVP